MLHFAPYPLLQSTRLSTIFIVCARLGMSSASFFYSPASRTVSKLAGTRSRQRWSKLNAFNDKNDTDSSIQSNAEWRNPKFPTLDALLQQTTFRAFRTLSTTAVGDWNDADDDVKKKNGGDTILDVIDAAVMRSSSTLSEAANDLDMTESKQHRDKRTYLNNPCVTPTALAHTLWKSSVIPNHDTVIDATCGNGKDCLALAKLLFPNELDTNSDIHPHLIAIDVQSRAIANTRRSLLSALSDEIYYNHVTVLEQSHEHLLDVIAPRNDRKSQEVGLVCYNLGYLPGGQATENNYKDFTTQTQTTLNSITDAALLLRVGGLLSVMTYPGTNLEESIAVEHFVEGLAMLTTRDEGGWRSYLESIPNYSSLNDRNEEEGITASEIRDMVSKSIERVANHGSPKQTWRTFLHKPLGRPTSPVLVTAHRIK